MTGLRFLDGGAVTDAYLADVQTLITAVCDIEDQLPSWELDGATAWRGLPPPLILGRYERRFAPPQSWLDCEWAVRQLLPYATAREVEREARAIWDAYHEETEQ